MNWFFKIFHIHKNKPEKNTHSSPMPEECSEILNLENTLNNLFYKDSYISKKEYQESISSYQTIVEYFFTLAKGGFLKDYCKQNNLSYDMVKDTLQKYENIEEFIEKHNIDYVDAKMVNEKEYLDTILMESDPNIVLDTEQRKVVLTDEDYCLVVAGAGAGKTTTVAAKVKYLVEKKQVNPSQILVISFTNKAVEELRERINKDLKIDVPIATFHSTGTMILNQENAEKWKIAEPSKLYFVIQNYLKSTILRDEAMVKKLILFFASYFDAPFDENDLTNFFHQVATSNFSTIRSDLNDFEKQILDIRTKKLITIQNEWLRSKEEVQIANFLYINGISYEYEPIYPYHIAGARKPYTPDFKIWQGENTAYIEHFGITQSGQNNRYSDDQLEMYKRNIQNKIQIHKNHGTTLIYTFSKYDDNVPLIEHLKSALVRHGFELNRRSSEEIITKMVSAEESRYIRRLTVLLERFINNFKVNGYEKEEFYAMRNRTTNVRTQLFLDICFNCYLEYERCLKEEHSIDFQDMINLSAKLLREAKEKHKTLDYQYIIVDEYQDISRQRFDLVNALSEVTKAKIIAVGDDWQSIYAFSGANITLFTQFQEKMGYAKILKIVKTYRNAQEIIDIAGNFIQRNQMQIKKSLQSPKTIKFPIIIYTYDNTRKKANAYSRSGANYEMARAVEKALEQMIRFDRLERPGKTSKIVLLGRYAFDGDNLEKSGLFEFQNNVNGKIRSVKYPNLDITFMTVHSAKGLGFDNVIVLNGKNETYGFPSQIETDPILKLVIHDDQSIDYAEERRLFYVALTRTKNRVYFVAPKQNPSTFLLEIKKNFDNVVLRGEWNEEPRQKEINKRCPICGYPLQYRYKNAYGLKLFICTNEPEVCGFMTNEYSAGKLSILKCDQCLDGYLIAKKSPEGNYFLGCTNYEKSGKGCNNTISLTQYYHMMGYSEDEMTRQTQSYFNTTNTSSKDNQNPQQQKVSKNALTQNRIIKADVPEVSFVGHNLNDLVYVTLKCLSQISKKKYYGVSILVDCLRGAKSKKIYDAGLDQVSTYGELMFLPREYVTLIVEWLIQEEYILQTKSYYPVLHPTIKGIQYHKNVDVNTLMRLKQYLFQNHPNQRM